MVAEVEGLVTVKSETLSLAGPEGYRQVASMRTRCEEGHRQMFLDQDGGALQNLRSYHRR